MSSVLPTRLAVISGAAAVLLAACSTDRVVSPVTSSRLPAQDIGIADPGITQVCIDPASPEALYTFSLSTPLNFLFGDVFEGAAVSINTAEGDPICRTVLRKFTFSDLTVASILIEASIFPNIPGTWSFTCVADDASSFCPVSGTTNTLRAGASGPHGSTITFLFTPTPLALVPLFVIGDEQIHTVGSTVNFWGAQWSKNNEMSGTVANGVAGFKGYAGTADDFCGGTWTSDPGNSSPPPATIPTQIAIIVTSSIGKSGSTLSGNIVKILLVDQDGGYNANPGHEGNGVVTEIICD